MSKILTICEALFLVLFFLNGGGVSLGSHGNSITVPNQLLPGGTYGERIFEGKNK